ncbi:survival motor neuron protein 1-like isoform X2 [Lepisosteus oculatus]|uniref:survival motor neuron protein 1-like isoform X2 n=1 Tax=Lepisosteus oculatus TaxID=7918 RepID=UPI00370F93C0
MAECHGEIVYLRSGNNTSESVGEDDSALIKAYEKAVRSFREPEAGEAPGREGEGGPESDGVGGSAEHMSAQWQVGSRCRAVWSGDGLVYPAVLRSVAGGRGLLRFEGYGNEEEVDLDALLPCETHTQGSEEEEDRTRPELLDAGRKGKKDPPDRQQREDAEEDHVSSSTEPPKAAKEREKDRARAFRGESRDRAHPRSSQPFLFPPAPPGHDGSMAFLPPPPPWARAEAADEDLGALSSLLLSWYLCGYHTGSYMASRQTRTAAGRKPARPKATWRQGKPTQ